MALEGMEPKIGTKRTQIEDAIDKLFSTVNRLERSVGLVTNETLAKPVDRPINSKVDKLEMALLEINERIQRCIVEAEKL